MQATPLPAVEVGSHGRTGEAARSTQPTGWASARHARGLAQKTNRLTEPTMEMLSAAIQVHECLEVNRCQEDGLGFTTAEERQRMESARRFYCSCVFLCSMAGVVLAVAENEVRWLGGTQNLSTVMKALVVCSTLLTFFFLYQYYDAAVSLRRLSGVRVGSGVTLRSLRGAGLLSEFAWELLVLLPQPLPGLDLNLSTISSGLGKIVVYDVDSLLVLAMFCRFAYLPRYYGEVLSDLRSEAALAVSRMNSVTFDNTFVIKYVLANSLNCVVLLTALLIILFAYMLMVFERPVDAGTLGHYANCIWLIIITMTTVGYGDEFPVTSLGRVVAIMAALAAVIMLAITVNLVVSKLTLSRSETKVLDVMDKLSLRDDLRENAAVVIQKWMQAYTSYMRRRSGGGRQRVGSGGRGAKAVKSALRLNIDLRQEVLSDIELLRAITVFAASREAYFHSRLENDVAELLGNVESKLHHQDARIQRLRTVAADIDRLSARLCELKGAQRRA